MGAYSCSATSTRQNAVTPVAAANNAALIQRSPSTANASRRMPATALKPSTTMPQA
jgi:hypothetical protein